MDMIKITYLTPEAFVKYKKNLVVGMLSFVYVFYVH
jgi:hypothetical protein